MSRELGRGGMGIVYLAHEVQLDRPVALKLLPPALAAQPALRERFLREARTAAKLSHPNIVPIFAVDAVGNFVFFAMAYVAGETLGERVGARGPVPASDGARILREVAWALAYAHAQGVVHRDIKPDNILLESGSGRALVADFGIAHLRDAPGVTAAGEVLGTAEFMSPEQASGEAVDHRSDMYALGVVGFYALSGRLPFEGPTVAAVLAKHLTQPAPPLTSVTPEVPARLARVIERCLAKDPAQRFGSGEELAEALGGAIEARREMPVPLRVFIKRDRETQQARPVVFLVSFLFVPGLLSAAGAGEPAGLVMAALIGGLLLSPMGSLALNARRLLKAGYGAEDAVLALKTELERRREELAFEFGRKPSRWERVATVVALASLGVFGASVSLLVWKLGPEAVLGSAGPSRAATPR